MLELSRSINPECEHIEGDMRTLRLTGRTFDAVFVHDAVSYLTTEADLRAAFETAFVHLRPGGAALFEPDHVRETYADATDHGGHDSADPSDPRALRYLQWRTDPDPDRHLVPRRVRVPAARCRRPDPRRHRPAHPRPVPAGHLVRAARRGRDSSTRDRLRARTKSEEVGAARASSPASRADRGQIRNTLVGDPR